MTAPGSTEPTSIGRYELSSTLGVGGFATVHRAYDPALDGDVAVKILLPQFVDNDDIRDRFLQEARLLRRVDSPHLVRVYDIGEIDSDGNTVASSSGATPSEATTKIDNTLDVVTQTMEAAANTRPFFVMELADGGVLSERYRGPVDRESLAAVVDALAGGLSTLHTANIVHRDIKPDNLLIAGSTKSETTQIGGALLADGERLLIGDLGLAKDHDRTSVGPTVSGGTPFYRAPEQMSPGAPITPAADIYAATGVVWFLLTGTHPPETQAVPAQLTSMPAAWQPVLQRGLEHDPTLRYATIDEWAMEARRAIEAAPSTGFDEIKVGEAANLCPYKGMAAFQPEDAGLYFGRDDMIDTLVAKIQNHSVLVIGGPSGSGKSSLMRAGLIPRLSRGAIAGSQQWRVALFNPGSDAVGELIHQIRQQASAASDTLRREDLPHGARRLLDDGTPTLLAIDQFEELFTLNPNRADQELFLETLASMTESEHSRIKVAIALRADFYGVCAAFPWLSERINESQLLVGPMSRQELRDAITIPAQRAGLRLEDGLADTILDDAGGGGSAGGGALPLLGHALMETWIRRRGSTMTAEGYQAAGGVTGAIAQRAEEVFTQLSPTDQAAARHLLLQLINPGEGTPDTRRRVARAALASSDGSAAVMEKLASARLLTIDDQAVEVAHEALIQSWPRLRGWIDDNRESLQIRRRIGVSAAEWIAQDRSSDLLYRGTQLVSALEWLDANPSQLDPDGIDFLTTAREVRDTADREQAAREARGKRNRRRAIGALAVLTLAAMAASVVALVALRRSQSNERAAEAQQVQALAAAATANASDQPLLATGLAVESIARANPSTAAARGSLVEARVGLDENRWLPQPFGHPVNVGDMQAVAITPDGTRFVTGGRQGQVVFWDLVTRTETQRFEDSHLSGVKAITISQDGRWMMSVGGWQAVLWDLAAETPEPILLHEIERIGGVTLWDAAFSDDSSLIAIATEGFGILTFDRASRRLISAGLTDSPIDPLSIAFLDNDRLVVGEGAGNLHILEVATGDSLGQPIMAGDDGNDVWEVSVSADRTMLSTVATDYTIKTWDIEPDGLSPVAVMDDPSIRNPQGVLWIRDGEELLVGASDGRLHRSDPMTGELLPGGPSAALHTDEIADSSASTNGWMVSLADDQRVQVWRYVGDHAPVDEVVATGDSMTDLALSPSGELLAAATVEGVVVHDAATGDLLHQFDGEKTSVVFVNDQLVAAGSSSGLLHLWDVTRGALIGENAGHGGSAIWSLVASPDGDHLASAANDGSVSVWDGETLEKVRDLEGHSAQTTGVDFTRDGETVISIGFDQLMRFSPVDGGETRVVPLPQDGPQTISVHPTEDLVAVGGSWEAIDVMDFDGNVQVSMAPHSQGVWDTVIAADGLSIVATSRDTGEVQLWDLATGERLGPIFGSTYDRIESDVVIDQNGVVWSSGTDGSIRRLDVLDQRVGCEISRNVMDARMQEQFLSSATLMSCP
jgi:WD40 repeat protein/serine/threonine protein kinase